MSADGHPLHPSSGLELQALRQGRPPHRRRCALQANQQKLRLETKQRAARKAAESGEAMRPRWFKPLGTTMGEGIAYVSAHTVTRRSCCHCRSPCQHMPRHACSDRRVVRQAPAVPCVYMALVSSVVAHLQSARISAGIPWRLLGKPQQPAMGRLPRHLWRVMLQVVQRLVTNGAGVLLACVSGTR